MRALIARIADFIRETDKLILILVTFASGYGCISVFSATRYMDNLRPAIVHTLSMFVGIVIALAVSSIDYEKYFKRWYLIAIGGLIPVILTFFIGIAPEGTDDKAWIDLGFTSFQPSEILKISFIITFSYHIKTVKEKINKPKYLLPLLLHGFFPVGLIILQGDYGTAIVFAFITAFMLWAGGVSIKYFIAGFSALLVASPFAYFLLLSDAHRERILNMFDIEADIKGIGFQQWRGRIALANGGFTGQGYLQGDITQSGILPEGHNDFIFCSIGEELGFLGCLVVIILLAAICLRCIRIARISTKQGGKLICVGIFAMIFAQSFINIGMCVSLLPVIGITLPFFSAGGTSLMCLMVGVGLVMSVYKHRNSRTIYLHD